MPTPNQTDDGRSYIENSIESHEVYQGAILWLPKKDQIKIHRQERLGTRHASGGVSQKQDYGKARHLTDGTFGHPIVVLSRDREGSEIEFVTVGDIEAATGSRECLPSDRFPLPDDKTQKTRRNSRRATPD